MKRKLEIGSVVAGCVLVLTGCGEPDAPNEPNSEGEIWAGTADIFVARGSFEPVAVGEDDTVELTLENRGMGPLRVRQVDFVEVSDDAVREFDLAGWSPEDGVFSLDPGGTARFTLTYDPQNRTADIARVSFSSNDPDEAVYTVELEPEVAQ